MRYIFYVLAFSIFSTLFWGCEKDETIQEESSVLFMTFDPRHHSEDVEIGERFHNDLNMPVEVLEMKFYISNLRAITESGNEIFLSEIEMLDIRDNIRTLEFKLPAGRYSGLAFDLGVPPNLNGTSNPDFLASVYDANHPLSANNGMYWGWAMGYRFFSFEGKCDTSMNQNLALPMSFAYHTGQDTLFRTLDPFNRNFTIPVNGNTVVPFSIDIEKIFIQGSDTVDFRHDLSFHGGMNPLGQKLADNTAAAISLKN